MVSVRNALVAAIGPVAIDRFSRSVRKRLVSANVAVRKAGLNVIAGEPGLAERLAHLRAGAMCDRPRNDAG
jgi:hypothetical protein